MNFFLYFNVFASKFFLLNLKKIWTSFFNLFSLTIYYTFVYTLLLIIVYYSLLLNLNFFSDLNIFGVVVEPLSVTFLVFFENRFGYFLFFLLCFFSLLHSFVSFVSIFFDYVYNYYFRLIFIKFSFLIHTYLLISLLSL